MEKDAARAQRGGGAAGNVRTDTGAGGSRGRRQQRKSRPAVSSRARGNRASASGDGTGGGEGGGEHLSFRERVAELEAQKLELEYDALKVCY